MDGYSFRPANFHDVPAILQFLYANFGHEEPLNQIFKLDTNDFESFFPEIVKECCIFPVSFLAEINGEIAGCQLNTLVERHDQQMNTAAFLSDSCPPAAQKLLGFLAKLNEGISDLLPADCSKFLKMSMVSVAKAHQRKGIAKHLKQLSVAVAKECECDAILAEATAMASQRLAASLGFTVLKTLAHCDYDEHMKAVDGTDCAQIVILRL